MLVRNRILHRLDYCNSLYSSLPSFLIQKLQRVQNAARRFIFALRKFDSVKNYLHDLHWLPVKQRIEYKVLIFVHKILFTPTTLPFYLNNLFIINRSHSRNQMI